MILSSDPSLWSFASFEVIGDLLQIAYFVVLPLLLMIGMGFVIQRRLGLDMNTLTRLNFYLVVPGMVYFAVVNSDVDGSRIALVVAFSLLAMLAWSFLSLLLAIIRRMPRDQRRAALMTTIFYNAGNYGLPLQNLAFRDAPTGAPTEPTTLSEPGLSSQAEGLQVFVMLVQNFTSFTIGVVLAAGRISDGMWRRNLLQIARFPPVYALAAAILTVMVRRQLGDHAPVVAEWSMPFWTTVDYVRQGFVVLALATLGAQLAMVTESAEHRYPVTPFILLRLLIAPAVGFLLLKLMGITGFTAQVLLISTATPTSVNCLLLCLEFRNHPDFVARAVFYSTLLSPVTVSLVILLARSGMLG